MDGRDALDVVQGSRRAPAGHLVSGRRPGRGDPDAQHSDCRHAARGDDRLRAERRGAASRAGVSRTPAAAGVGGQRQRQVASPPGTVGSAVHDARGDVEVHRPAGRRVGPPVQLRHGRALDHHRAVVSADRHTGLDRDPWNRLERSRCDTARGCQHRPGQDVEGRRAAAARAAQGAHAVPPPLALGWTADRDPQPCGRRDRIRAARVAGAPGRTGRRTRYHQNPITGWTIGSDGRVRFGLERVRT